MDSKADSGVASDEEEDSAVVEAASIAATEVALAVGEELDIVAAVTLAAEGADTPMVLDQANLPPMRHLVLVVVVDAEVALVGMVAALRTVLRDQMAQVGMAAVVPETTSIRDIVVVEGDSVTAVARGEVVLEVIASR